MCWELHQLTNGKLEVNESSRDTIEFRDAIHSEIFRLLVAANKSSMLVFWA